MNFFDASLLRAKPFATAGAFVSVGGGYFAFAVGPNREKDALGIVRLGGHVEQGEGPWACTARELGEEAGLRRFEWLAPPQTYYQVFGGPVEPWGWDRTHGPAPLLLKNLPQALTALYWVRAQEQPVAGAEIRGLLFLRPSQITDLLESPTTLAAFIAAGGQVQPNPAAPPLDSAMLLRPSNDLRAFAEIVHRHPEIATDDGVFLA